MRYERQRNTLDSMVRVNHKLLSVNKAWRGRRFKTPEYSQFERDILLMLPKIQVSKEKLKVSLIFAFSNKLMDIDNPCKLIIDIFQKKYGFNDSQIYELNIKKIIVEKGKEYFEFEINKINT